MLKWTGAGLDRRQYLVPRVGQPSKGQPCLKLYLVTHATGIHGSGSLVCLLTDLGWYVLRTNQPFVLRTRDCHGAFVPM